MSKVIITEDSNSEMLSIQTSEGKYLFEGNYWDFDRCGISFKEMFEDLGIEVELTEKDYDEWD